MAANIQMTVVETIANGILTVKIPKYFRDSIWADGFAGVQTKLQASPADESFSSILVDFGSCVWADPIPLLSLLLYVIEYRKRGSHARAILPDYSSIAADSPDLAVELARFVKFLAHEGFLHALDDNRVVVCDGTGSQIGKQRIDELGMLTAELAYQNAKCIPATVIHFPSSLTDDEAPAYVNRQIDRLLNDSSIDVRLKRNIPAIQRESLRSRLLQVLGETLLNVHEHAYLKRRSWRPAAIYVRFRTGGLEISQEHRGAWRAQLDAEEKFCPRLEPEYMESRRQVLEVFVVDIGQGLVNSLRNSTPDLAAELEKRTRPFAWLAKQVFESGISRKTARATAQGGLRLLHNLLEQHGDYIRGLDDATWMGASVPKTRDYTNQRLAQQILPGLHWHFRLSWRSKGDIGPEWTLFNQSFPNPLFAELCSNANASGRLSEWWINDERFDDYPMIRGRFGLGSQPSDLKSSDPRYVLWLVRRDRSKRDIAAMLESLKALPDDTAEKPRVLIIADIRVHDAPVYMAAFSGATYSPDWVAKISLVILASEHLAFSVFRRQLDKTPRYCLEEAHFVGPFPTAGRFAPDRNPVHIVRAIRSWDSERFWRAIGSNIGDYCYVPNDVLWRKDGSGQELRLKGFLDFSQAVTNPLCREILRRAVSRIQGIFPSPVTSLIGLDGLTTTFIDEFLEIDSGPDNSQPNDLEPVYFGSVYVSGTTQRAAAPAARYHVHALKHPDAIEFPGEQQRVSGESTASEKGVAFLLLWPRESEWFRVMFPRISGLSNLKRIGTTPAIAPDGWKFYEIPRYNASAKALAARTPAESYEDWQAPANTLMKVGHWAYQSHHDLVTLHLSLAVEAAFKTHSDLACFIFFNTLGALGVAEADLTADGQVLRRKVFEGPESWVARIGQKADSRHTRIAHAGVLIYQSHPNTDRAIELLINLVAPNARPLLAKRIIAMRSLRRLASGSPALVPPLVLERIKQQIAELENRSAVIFDDAVISGKTLHGTSNLLQALGLDEVSFVALIDRRRLPGVEDSPYNSLNYYWRLDVPTLGGASSCPLCSAQLLARSFRNALCSEYAKQRIDEWVRDWQPISPAKDWRRGIFPTALAHAVEKKFALRNGAEQGARIKLARSVGLVSWVSELHTMTCRDDLSLSIAEDGLKFEGDQRFDIGPQSRIELLASQLLLFGDEYPTKTQQLMLIELLRAMQELSGQGTHTALAGLCHLLFAPQNVSSDSSWAAAIKSMVSKSQEFDDRTTDQDLVLAYMLSAKAISNDGSDFDFAERLLSAKAETLFERLNKFHREVIDFPGYQHAGPLCRIQQWERPMTKRKLRSGSDSLDKLEDLLSSFDAALANSSWQAGQPRFQEVLSKFDDQADQLKIEISRVIEELGDSGEIERDARLVEKVTDVLKLMSEVHSFFFFDIDKPNIAKRTFEDTAISIALESLTIDGFQNEPDSPIVDPWRFFKQAIGGLSARPTKLWVLWDSRIAETLVDLVQNAIGPCSDRAGIRNPWAGAAGEEKAVAWIQVQYRNEGIDISIANGTVVAIDYILDELNRKARARWHHLFSVGGFIAPPKSLGGGVVSIQLHIPYAGSLSVSDHKVWWCEDTL